MLARTWHPKRLELHATELKLIVSCVRVSLRVYGRVYVQQCILAGGWVGRAVRSILLHGSRTLGMYRVEPGGRMGPTPKALTTLLAHGLNIFFGIFAETSRDLQRP